MNWKLLIRILSLGLIKWAKGAGWVDPDASRNAKPPRTTQPQPKL